MVVCVGVCWCVCGWMGRGAAVSADRLRCSLLGGELEEMRRAKKMDGG
jgi:hypothetical protein